MLNRKARHQQVTETVVKTLGDEGTMIVNFMYNAHINWWPEHHTVHPSPSRTSLPHPVHPSLIPYIPLPSRASLPILSRTADCLESSTCDIGVLSLRTSKCVDNAKSGGSADHVLALGTQQYWRDSRIRYDGSKNREY